MKASMMCLAGVAVLLLVGSSWGIPLVYEEGPNVGQVFVSGPLTFKMTSFGVGTIYPAGTGPAGYSGLPSAVGEEAGATTLDGLQTSGATGALALAPYSTTADGLEDSWGVGRITRIQDSVGNAVWTSAGKGFELNVLFYGEQDIFIEPISATEDRINGVGLIVDIYSNPLGSFDPTGGTAARGAGNTYPGITGGVLELSMISLPGFIHVAGTGAGLATQFESRFNFNSLFGEGEAYMELTGGASFAQFNTDGFAMSAANAAILGPLGHDLTADLAVQFSTSPATVADWLVTIDDPIRAHAIPEPATGLLLASLSGTLFLARRVRRRAAR